MSTTEADKQVACDATPQRASQALPSSSTGSTPDSSPARSATTGKRSGRGMSMRRRIGLKIEADESEALNTNGGSEDDGCSGRADAHDSLQQQKEGRALSSSRGEQPGEEWWKVEYRAPPPGHLGAHAIARDDKHTSPTASERNRIDATERKLERMEVTPHPVHETPERAKKVRGGSDLYDAATSHSSPNPKRKIMDLHDIEAGTFPSMGVAKEPKRFHEINVSDQHIESECELSRSLRAAPVTPSNLVRPMKKIDIQAGSSVPSLASTRTPGHHTAADTSAAKASESA